MRYEYGIRETVHEGPGADTAPGQTTVGPSGWGNAIQAMNTASHDGWELINSTLSAHEWTDPDSGKPRRRTTALTLWQRPLDE